ncbi:MAG: hypothetical protein ACE5IW_13080 [bacterium]
MKNKKLTEKQLDLLSKTLVDIGKLVLAALVLAQILSEKPVNLLLFVFGLLVLIVLTLIGTSILSKKDDN